MTEKERLEKLSRDFFEGLSKLVELHLDEARAKEAKPKPCPTPPKAFPKYELPDWKKK